MGSMARLAAAPVPAARCRGRRSVRGQRDRKSTRLNSSHLVTSYAVFCLKKKTATAWRPRYMLLVTTLTTDYLQEAGPPLSNSQVTTATDGGELVHSSARTPRQPYSYGP